MKSHCLQAFAYLEVTWRLITVNGPEYVSKGFQQFCMSFYIHHNTHVPYNPQGQVIVEGANAMLKHFLKK